MMQSAHSRIALRLAEQPAHISDFSSLDSRSIRTETGLSAVFPTVTFDTLKQNVLAFPRVNRIFSHNEA